MNQINTNETTAYERLVFEDATDLMRKQEGRVGLLQALSQLNRQYAYTSYCKEITHGKGMGNYWWEKMQASADMINKLEAIEGVTA